MQCCEPPWAPQYVGKKSNQSNQSINRVKNGCLVIFTIPLIEELIFIRHSEEKMPVCKAWLRTWTTSWVQIWMGHMQRTYNQEVGETGDRVGAQKCRKRWWPPITSFDVACPMLKMDSGAHTPSPDYLSCWRLEPQTMRFHSSAPRLPDGSQGGEKRGIREYVPQTPLIWYADYQSSLADFAISQFCVN